MHGKLNTLFWKGFSIKLMRTISYCSGSFKCFSYHFAPLCINFYFAKVFLLTSTSPNLLRTIINVGTHNYVLDDSNINFFDKKMEEMIKKAIHEKPKASPSVIVVCLAINIIMEKVLVSFWKPLP